MTRVSYVVTVYNKAPYLPFLLDGLARQQGGFAREFVFVDDGSSDGSLEALNARASTRCRPPANPALLVVRHFERRRRFGTFMLRAAP